MSVRECIEAQRRLAVLLRKVKFIRMTRPVRCKCTDPSNRDWRATADGSTIWCVGCDWHYVELSGLIDLDAFIALHA